MAQGWQTGAKCLPSVELAASEACSMAYGMTNAGLLSCSAFTVSGNTATLQMSNATEVAVTLQTCDRMTYADTWAPLFFFFLIGTISIWGAKLLINMFHTGGENV